MNEIRGVYKITNKKSGLIYIGVSQNCCDRIKQHLWELKRGKHSNDRLQQDFDKYGENKFKFNIIYEADIDENLNDLEPYFISNYKSNFKTYGYNKNKGGNYRDYVFENYEFEKNGGNCVFDEIGEIMLAEYDKKHELLEQEIHRLDNVISQNKREISKLQKSANEFEDFVNNLDCWEVI